MSTLTSSLIVRLVDQVSRPARSVTNSLLGIQRETGRTGRMSFGDRLSAGIRRNDAALVNARGGLIDAAAGFYALRTAIAAPVQSAMGFEAAMSRVGAVSRASDEELAAMTSTARELGATTSWTASEAAQGMQYLAMAGFEVNEVISAMPGMLSLASAAGTDLAATADIASNMMSGFGMEAEEIGRIGDVLVNTFTSSNTDLRMLGDTMGYVAPVANELGASIETVAGMTGLLGNAGIQGSRAGTALRAMYARLSAPPAEAAAAIESLGVQITDANGNMRDMPTILAEMDAAMGGMGDAARAEIISAIFGMEAMSAAAVLMGEASSGGLQTYIETLHEAGSANRVAAEMLDNARGAFRRLASAWESLSISLGQALMPGLVRLVETLIPVINRIDEFITLNPELSATIFRVAAGLVAFRVGLAGLRFVGLLGRGGALSLLSLGLNTVGRASLGLYAAAAANVAYQGSLAAMAGAGRLTKLQRLGAALRGMAFAVPGVAALSGVFGWLAGAATAVGAAIAGVSAPVWAAIGVAVAAVAAAGFSLWKWWDTLSATFSGVARRIGEELRPAFEAIQPVLDAISPVTTAVGSAFRGMGEAIGSVIDWFQSRWGEFASWISGFFQREILTPEEAAAAEQRGYDMADRVINAIKGVFIGLRDLGVEAIQNLLAGMQAAWAALNDWAGGVPDRIVSAIASLSSEMLSTGRAMMQSMWDGAVETFSGFIEWLRGIPGRIVEAVGSISLSDIIQWPSPPQWMTDLLGDGEAVNSRIGGISRQDGPTTPSGIALETHEEVQPSAAPYAALSQEQANAAAVLERASTSGLPDEGHLSNLREEATLLQQAISEIQAEIAAAGDSPLLVPNVERANADIRALQTQLQSVQAELTEGERITQEVTAALQVLAGTEVTPEISTDSITRALEQVRALSRELSALRGSVGNVPGPAIDGARASGGDVRSGGTYLVGEEGPELVTFGQRGFVHNARATMRAMRGATARLASGAGFDVGFPDIHSLIRQGSDALSVTGGQMFPAPASVQPASPQITLNLPAITINGVQDIRGAAGEIRDMLEQELALAMRGLHADLGGA